MTATEPTTAPADDRRARLERALRRLWSRRGPPAWALLPLAGLYGLVSAIRRMAYRQGWLPRQTLGLPVIVIGNLIVGGAGKTPATLALVEHLRSRGWQPGVVSRGHGRRDDGDAVLDVQPHDDAVRTGDEPLLLRRRAQVPVFVHRERARAARALCAAHPDVDVLVADDGLQHLALARDIEVVVFDRRGLGNGWWLPAGPLREGLGARHGARHRLVLYTDGQASTPAPGHVAHRRLGGLVRFEDWRAGRWDARHPLSVLAGRPVAARAGIAQPEVFFQTLRDAGLELRARPLPDHAPYEENWLDGEGPWVLTEKDAVKLPDELPAAARGQVWVAALDFTPPPSFFAALDAALTDYRGHGSTTA